MESKASFGTGRRFGRWDVNLCEHLSSIARSRLNLFFPVALYYVLFHFNGKQTTTDNR